MSDLVERLRHADTHSQQRVLGSRIFGEAADEIERMAREIDRLRTAMGAEGQQFMQALVDEASTELQKRKAAEAELARLRSECADGLDALSDIDDFWEASPYPGNRKHLTPAEQISSLVCELNAAHDQVAALKSSEVNPRQPAEQNAAREDEQAKSGYAHHLDPPRIKTVASCNHGSEESRGFSQAASTASGTPTLRQNGESQT